MHNGTIAVRSGRIRQRMLQKTATASEMGWSGVTGNYIKSGRRYFLAAVPKARVFASRAVFDSVHYEVGCHNRKLRITLVHSVENRFKQKNACLRHSR